MTTTSSELGDDGDMNEVITKGMIMNQLENMFNNLDNRLVKLSNCLKKTNRIIVEMNERCLARNLDLFAWRSQWRRKNETNVMKRR